MSPQSSGEASCLRPRRTRSRRGSRRVGSPRARRARSPSCAAPPYDAIVGALAGERLVLRPDLVGAPEDRRRLGPAYQPTVLPRDPRREVSRDVHDADVDLVGVRVERISRRLVVPLVAVRAVDADAVEPFLEVRREDHLRRAIAAREVDERVLEDVLPADRDDERAVLAERLRPEEDPVADRSVPVVAEQ